LEREFEAWIVAGIEEYAASLGWPVEVWAVHPDDEKHWPADEKVWVPGKVLGLQFKSAHVLKRKSGAVAYDRLRWTFGQPPGQYKLVQATKEIFYCLPTFVNRQCRNRALDHCLFWRPPAGTPKMSAWYGNPDKRVTKSHNDLGASVDAVRWGTFIERIESCTEGRAVEKPEDLGRFDADMKEVLREYLPPPPAPPSGTKAPDSTAEGADDDEPPPISGMYEIAEPRREPESALFGVYLGCNPKAAENRR